MAPDLDKLGQQLDQIRDAKSQQQTVSEQNLKDAENMGNGMRAGAELVAPIVESVSSRTTSTVRLSAVTRGSLTQASVN